MRVIVTGGAGFIGSSVCRALVRAGTAVAVLDDLSTGRRENLDGVPVDLVEGSILDGELLSEQVAGADAVVHLAAQVSVPDSMQDPERTHQINVTGTLRVLEAARASGAAVVVASSAAVYGASPAEWQSESQLPRPLSPYGVSKLATEAYALAWAQAYDMSCLALRFFNVYGPRQLPSDAYAAVVPAFVSRALAHEVLHVDGDGDQTRDFVSVTTVAEIIRRAVTDRVCAPGPVNVAFGTRTSLLDLVDLIGDLVGRPLQVEHGPRRAGDVRSSRGDGRYLASLFPDIAAQPLRDGLSETIAWHLSRRTAPHGVA